MFWLLAGLLPMMLSASAAAAFVRRNISTQAPMLAGSLFLLAGMGLTFGAIATTTSEAFIAGAAVAGPGFGLAFLGSFRMIMAHAMPDLRGGLVAAIYIVGYLAFSVPALIAGVATTKVGLHSTALVYAVSLAAMPAAAVGILLSRAGGNAARPSAASQAVMPPGPCTTPPCPEATNPAEG